MINENIDSKLLEIIDHYGSTNQEDILIEEMSELTKAIIKMRRNHSFENFKNVVEEIADVLVMIEQLQLILSLSEPQIKDYVNEEIKYKIGRQLGRMEADT